MKAIQITEHGGPETLKYQELPDLTPGDGDALLEIQAVGVNYTDVYNRAGATPGLPLGILTADCTPILFADPEAGVIGAAHAGWSGAAQGIALNTIAAMVALGADPACIRAAIGPTISGPNYEVGDPFRTDLLAIAPDGAPFFTTPYGGKPHFDLPGFVEAQLRAARIGPVENLGICTYADPVRYFSHRYATHHQTKTGRQIAVIALT